MAIGMEVRGHTGSSSPRRAGIVRPTAADRMGSGAGTSDHTPFRLDARLLRQRFRQPWCSPAARGAGRHAGVRDRLNANQQLAREIYKELVEINTGVTTGNITAPRRQWRGKPGRRDSRSPTFLSRAARGEVQRGANTRKEPPNVKPILLLARRRRRSAPSAFDASIVRVHRTRRILLRARDRGRQGDGLHFVKRLSHEEEGYVPDRDIIIALPRREVVRPMAWTANQNHRDLVTRRWSSMRAAAERSAMASCSSTPCR
jgi:hypothetical protein